MSVPNRFDIVQVGDFRLRGGTSTAIATEVELYAKVGLHVGLLHVDAPFEVNAPIHPAIQECLTRGQAVWLQADDEVDCRLLVLHNPLVFREYSTRHFRVRAQSRIMVAHHVPLSPAWYLNYNPWRMDTFLRRAFGGPIFWAPNSPVCRRQFEKAGFDLPMLADDWHNTINVEDWGSPRSAPLFERCVVGRHSRPEADKWPATASEVRFSLPDASDFDVRILGVGGYLRGLVGVLPKNWATFEFGARSAREFLQTIDFFVYFHHPTTLESFNRAAMEAAASGCVIILPGYLRDVFKDGALYCAPQEVEEVVRALHADKLAFARQSRLGYETVRNKYGPESFLRVVRLALDQPRLVDRASATFVQQMRHLAVRSTLRSRYHIGRAKRALRSRLGRIRRYTEDHLPTSARERLRESRGLRSTARAPDRPPLVRSLIPALVRALAVKRDAKVLWVGCRPYTVGYYTLIESAGAKCWTIDIEPEVEPFGREGRHVTLDLLRAEERFDEASFDAVLCNGILGWGIDTIDAQTAAFKAIARLLRPGGWLALGWDADRSADPLSNSLLTGLFDHANLPGFGVRCIVEGNAHIYDILRRNEVPA